MVTSVAFLWAQRAGAVGLVDVVTLSLSLGTEVTHLSVNHPPTGWEYSTGSQGGGKGSRADSFLNSS